MVMSVAMIHFSKGYTAKSTQRKDKWGQNQKKPDVTFQSLPLESHRRLLPPPALSCDSIEVLSTQEALLRLESRVFNGTFI